MAFIDELQFHAHAGKGGDGIVSWLHEKGKEFSGAAGGDGGRGGDVYIRGVRDYAILAKYRNIKDFAAKDGERGKSRSMFGKNGDDLVIDVPIGSVVKNMRTGRMAEVMKEDELVFILKGGKGGYGNVHFKASTNVTPMQQTDGREGEEADFFLEVKLVVDVGFAGFPNAGKSSLLNAVTNATAKVGAYQFTTLEPNLGALYEFVLADIPGLIEGASEGKGLGFKFLRHVSRTKLVLHCVSLENEDITLAYNTVRKELEAFNKTLAEKNEILLLTKTDMVTPAILKKKITEAKKLNKNVMTVSILDDESVKTLKDELVKKLRAIAKKEKNDSPETKEPKPVQFESESIPTTHLEERVERAIKKMNKKK